MNKAMKKAIVILILIAVLGCSSEKKNSTKYVQHRIEFLNWNVNIPDNYESVSFDDYKELVKEGYTDSVFVANKMVQIDNFKNNFQDYAMFCDKNNFENNITIVSMLNPKPDEFIRDQLASMVHTDLKARGEADGYVYKPIENRLIDNWLIKIKGKKTFSDLDVVIYRTSYMASNFAAYVFNNQKDMDFQKELTE